MQVITEKDTALIIAFLPYFAKAVSAAKQPKPVKEHKSPLLDAEKTTKEKFIKTVVPMAIFKNMFLISAFSLIFLFLFVVQRNF